MDQYVITGDGAKPEAASAPEAIPQNRVDPSPSADARAALRLISRPGVKPDTGAGLPTGSGPIDPKLLLGKNEWETKDMLGPPGEIRTAASATIWQYKTDTCTLDLFFYMDLGTRSLKTLDYEVKTPRPSGNGSTNSACTEQIRKMNSVGRN